MKKMFVAFTVFGLLLVGCSTPKVSVTYDISPTILGDTDKAISLEGDKGSIFDEEYFLTVDDLKQEYQATFKGWYNAETDEEIKRNHVFEDDTIIIAKFYTETELKEQEEAKAKRAEERKKRAEKAKKQEEKKKEEEKNNFEPTEDQLRMIQATTQIAIKDRGFEDDTSVFLEDWDITVHTQFEELRWMAVTSTGKNGRIKVMFDWSGEDEDDLMLVYMLVGGETILDRR